MARVTGWIEGDLPATGITYVGVFAGPRMFSEPVAWTSLAGPGAFQLDDVPPGNWYVHGVHCASWEPGMPAFPTPTAWGSAGGPYGHGRPVAVDGDVTGLRLLLHSAWRDLTHTPAPLQPALPEYHRQAVLRAAAHLAAAQATVNWLEELLKEVNLTRSFMTGLFKRATGMSLQEYRTRVLLERAKGMLIETELDVLEVALEVGWSASQFTRLFKRYVGLTPSEFRRLARTAQTGFTACPRTPPEASSHATVSQPAVSPQAALSAPAVSSQAPVSRPAVSSQAAAVSPPTVSPRTPVSWPTLTAQLDAGTVVTGTVTYQGMQEGVIIYIGAFPGPVPDTYPRAWTSLPGPGSFTLRIPPGSGEVYILACYCRRRMRYPGDMATSFADGGYGPISCTPGGRAEVAITLTDSDHAASFSGRWFHAFLPDGR